MRQPQLFEWLLEPGVLHRPKSKEDLAQEARQVVAAAPTPERKWTALRRYKSQEILRIGLQDLVGRQNLVGITEELSNLADTILGTGYELCRSDLVRRHGAPQLAGEADRGGECAFVILGMGKLGGRELNFSSDIDLIFVYEEDGEQKGDGDHDPQGFNGREIDLLNDDPEPQSATRPGVDEDLAQDPVEEGRLVRVAVQPDLRLPSHIPHEIKH